MLLFFFSSRRRHTRCLSDWSSDVCSSDLDGKPLPGVAQVAMQQGRHVGGSIARRVAGQAPPRPFHYFDKGNMAVIGRNFAILESGRWELGGFVAWLAWVAIHILFLYQSRLNG